MQSCHAVETPTARTPFVALKMLKVGLHTAVNSLAMRPYPAIAFRTAQLSIPMQGQRLVDGPWYPLTPDFYVTAGCILDHFIIVPPANLRCKRNLRDDSISRI